MTSPNFNFSNLDQLQYDNFEQNYSFGNQRDLQFHQKDASFNPTTDPFANQIIEEPFYEQIKCASRSKKTCENPFESSFQTNFQYEHIEACQKKIQNFMEAIAQCSEKIQKQELKTKIIQSQTNSSTSCITILESFNCQIEQSQKQKFKADLKFQKKLNEFLDQMCKKFVPEVAGELVAIADFIWLNYTNIMDERLSESELINWAKNLAESKFKEYIKLLEKTKEICFSEDENQIFPNFNVAIKEFMNFFFVTIVLVIEQCFENPYFQDGKNDARSFKRASSQEDCYSFDQFSELQEDIYGYKKLKY